jgi:hypothetical protein
MIILLALFMKAPVWFLIARIDFAGGSTGFFRAALISSTIDHFREWWLVGTNYTRHWMPTGVSWSPDHTDITNYYISMGVIGGMPTLISFVLIIIVSFRELSKSLRLFLQKSFKENIIVWTLGATLFAHIFTFLSIAYFDQLVVFWYLHLAMIGSLYSQAIISCDREAFSVTDWKI